MSSKVTDWASVGMHTEECWPSPSMHVDGNQSNDGIMTSCIKPNPSHIYHEYLYPLANGCMHV